jgi:hypothetical protein
VQRPFHRVGGAHGSRGDRRRAAFRGEHPQGADGPVGIGRAGVHKGRERIRHRRRGGRIEEVGGVLQPRVDPVVGLRQLQPHVEHGGPGVHRLRRQAQPRHLQHRVGNVLQRQCGLEDGVVAQTPVRVQRLHQSLERHVLVGERLQHRLAHRAQQRAERRSPREVRAQGDHVGERPHQPLQLGMGAARDRGAHHHVVGAGQPVQEHGVGGQVRHEGRRALRTRHRRQAPGGGAGEAERVHSAAMALARGAGPVRGERQHGGRPSSRARQ